MRVRTTLCLTMFYLLCQVICQLQEMNSAIAADLILLRCYSNIKMKSSTWFLKNSKSPKRSPREHTITILFLMKFNNRIIQKFWTPKLIPRSIWIFKMVNYPYLKLELNNKIKVATFLLVIFQRAHRLKQKLKLFLIVLINCVHLKYKFSNH